MTTTQFQLTGARSYDINQHVDYVLGIISAHGHETFGLQATLELISFHLSEYAGFFSSEFFVTKFAVFLEKNDVIPTPVAGEVYKLSERILALHGRNYKLVDLIRAFQVVLKSYEVQAESLKNEG